MNPLHRIVARATVLASLSLPALSEEAIAQVKGSNQGQVVPKGQAQPKNGQPTGKGVSNKDAGKSKDAAIKEKSFEPMKYTGKLDAVELDPAKVKPIDIGKISFGVKLKNPNLGYHPERNPVVIEAPPEPTFHDDLNKRSIRMPEMVNFACRPHWQLLNLKELRNGLELLSTSQDAEAARVARQYLGGQEATIKLVSQTNERPHVSGVVDFKFLDRNASGTSAFTWRGNIVKNPYKSQALTGWIFAYTNDRLPTDKSSYPVYDQLEALKLLPALGYDDTRLVLLQAFRPDAVLDFPEYKNKLLNIDTFGNRMDPASLRKRVETQLALISKQGLLAESDQKGLATIAAKDCEAYKSYYEYWSGIRDQADKLSGKKQHEFAKQYTAKAAAQGEYILARIGLAIEQMTISRLDAESESIKLIAQNPFIGTSKVDFEKYLDMPKQLPEAVLPQVIAICDAIRLIKPNQFEGVAVLPQEIERAASLAQFARDVHAKCLQGQIVTLDTIEIIKKCRQLELAIPLATASLLATNSKDVIWKYRGWDGGYHDALTSPTDRRVADLSVLLGYNANLYRKLAENIKPGTDRGRSSIKAAQYGKYFDGSCASTGLRLGDKLETWEHLLEMVECVRQLSTKCGIKIK